MKRRGQWGDPNGRLPRIVDREKNTMTNATTSRDEEKEVQGPAPKLRYVSSPVYQRKPYDPEFLKQEAKGDPEVGETGE
jgi:hypothetical protein